MTARPLEGAKLMALCAVSGLLSAAITSALSGTISIAAILLALALTLLGTALLQREGRERARRTDKLARDIARCATGDLPLLTLAKEDELAPVRIEAIKAISELRATREQSREERASLAKSLATVAHQLKTPISACSSTVETLSARAIARDGIAIERLKAQLARLGHLTSELLASARDGAGALELIRKPNDAFTALTLAADAIEDYARERGTEILVDESGPVRVDVDLAWTVEAFSNLIRNCVDHAPAGGHIRCRCTQNPIYAEVTISDDGPGFSSDDLPHLFEPFYRGAYSSPDATGLGLSVARSIVEQQNGSICARNLPEGGACFEVRLYRH